MTLNVDIVIASAVTFAEIVVISVIVFRRMWRTYPIFSVFMVWSALIDAAASWILSHASREVYFSFYFKQLVPDAILQFAVLIELFWAVLKPVRASLPRKSIFILVGIVALAGVAIWPLAAMAIPPGLTDQGRIYVHLQETTSVLRVLFFVVMACFSQLLVIGWRDREMQIATGLGVYSMVSLIVAVLHTSQDPAIGSAQYEQYLWLNRIVTISYLGSLLYWVLSFSTREQERQEFSPKMQQLLVQMGGGARTGRVALTDLPHERSKKRDK